MKNAIMLWGVFSALLSGGCSRNHKSVRTGLPEGFTPDIGPEMHEFGRPAVWQVDHLDLGDTGFIASVGPSRYQDEPDGSWDYYSIEVELKEDGDSWYVCFQRDLSMDNISPELLRQRADEIVTFDARTGVVTFTIGEEVYTYRLPKRQPRR